MKFQFKSTNLTSKQLIFEEFFVDKLERDYSWIVQLLETVEGF